MISFEATSRFRSCLKKGGLDRHQVFAAMQLTAAAWGQPHLHSGRGIRRLTQGLYECRLSRDIRLLFITSGDSLIFDFAGTHDQIQAFLKSRR